MKILFLASACIPFHGRTLDESPLGGTETAVSRLAAALAKRGHEVIVAVSHPNPPLSEPLYIPLNAVADVGPVDVLVAVRDWHALFSGVPAKKQLLWVHDTADQPVTVGFADPRVLQRSDALLAVSNWHREHINAATGVSLHKIKTLRNAVELGLFAGAETRDVNRLIYSSTPFRGLRYLPQIMRALEKLEIAAELHVFSGYAVYGGNGNRPASEVAAFQAIEAALRNTPRTTVHGNVSQAQLAREFMKSSILVYPNTFSETSCITVMEAQAAGCVTVTSRHGALPETVGEGGIMISGTPETPGYLEEFVAGVAKVVKDRALWEKLSRAARAQSESCSWGQRALEFEALC